MITTCFVLSILNYPTAWSKDLDASDNKAPVLISISIDKYSLVEGETGTVTVVIRDDKNELQGWPTVLFGAPAESPGSISGGIFAGGGKGLTDTRLSADYVEQTFQFTYTAPSWPGQYYGFNIQGVRDKNGNAIGFDLKRCDNKNIYSNPQLVSFPNITPTCDTNFTVRLLTEEEKAQLAKAASDKLMANKAAADKAAAEKAAAGKAAQDKVAADKAEIRNLLDSVANQIASLKLKSGANIVRVQQSTLDRLNLAFQVVNESGYSEIHLLAQKVQSELLALEQVFAKEKSALKKTTITCIKGKVAKKVTAVNAKCPAGYKKK